MVDLGHRGAEPAVELGLDRLQLLALGLQALRLGEVQVDQQQGGEGAHRSTAARLRELALDLAGLVDLQHIALLDVGEVLEHDAALEAGRDLADVVVEALAGCRSSSS